MQRFLTPREMARLVPQALHAAQDQSASILASVPSIAAERYLSQLGLRTVRIRIDGTVGHIEADPRDLWRVVARRDEVMARLHELGLERVTIDLETKRSRIEPPAFS
jgi:PP-loop superfamily ATP-utilizing enzyme